MTTEMLTLVHPDRNDTITVSTAAARIRRKAGWITEAEAAELPALAELTAEQRAALADLVAALDAEPDPNHNPAIVPGTEAPEIPEKASDRTDWIGNDPDRARAALADEQTRTKPRKSVLDHIEAVTTPDESQED